MSVILPIASALALYAPGLADEFICHVDHDHAKCIMLFEAADDAFDYLPFISKQVGFTPLLRRVTISNINFRKVYLKLASEEVKVVTLRTDGIK